MNVVGLNDLLLRSLTDTYVESGFTFAATLFLFRGTVPSTFEEANIEASFSSFDTRYKELMSACAGVTDVLLSIDRSTPKIKLNLTNGVFSHSREKGDWTKLPSSTPLRLNGVTTTLGDAVIYYPANATTRVNTTTPNPTPVTDDIIYSSKSRVFQYGAVAGKNYISYGNGLGLYFGRRTNPGNSEWGSGAVIFKDPVDADFILIQQRANAGDASTDQNLGFVQLLNMSDQWVTIPDTNFTMGDGVLYRINFTKQKIKGLRYQNTVTTQADRSRYYNIAILTAGLADYSSDPKFNTSSLTNYTYGILMPNEDNTTRSLQTRKPLMLVSIGTDAGNDIKTVRNANYLIDPDLFVANQTLLELDE